MLRGDTDPPQVREFRNAGLATEPTHATGLGAAEGHLCLVLHGGAVDVTDSRVDALRDAKRGVDVAAEYRGRKTVFGIVGQLHGMVRVAGAQHADNGTE